MENRSVNRSGRATLGPPMVELEPMRLLRTASPPNAPDNPGSLMSFHAGPATNARRSHCLALTIWPGPRRDPDQNGIAHRVDVLERCVPDLASSLPSHWEARISYHRRCRLIESRALLFDPSLFYDWFGHFLISPTAHQSVRPTTDRHPGSRPRSHRTAPAWPRPWSRRSWT